MTRALANELIKERTVKALRTIMFVKYYKIIRRLGIGVERATM
jgi:hypothetical protein